MNQRYTYRNPKILAHARGQACTNCGTQDDTTVAAHSNLQEHGKGRGLKAHDIYVAYLCHACHRWLDAVGNLRDPTGLYYSNATDKREMFTRAMHKTLLILVKDGVLS